MIPEPITNNWDAFGEIEQQAKEMQEKQEEEQRHTNRMFYEALSTKAGMFIYTYFKKFTLDLPSITPGMTYEQAMVHGNRREGQNDIVREMKFRAERGKQGL